MGNGIATMRWLAGSLNQVGGVEGQFIVRQHNDTVAKYEVVLMAQAHEQPTYVMLILQPGPSGPETVSCTTSNESIGIMLCFPELYIFGSGQRVSFCKKFI